MNESEPVWQYRVPSGTILQQSFSPEAGHERRTPNPLRITFVEVAAMVNRAAQQVVIGWSESLSVGALMNH